MQHANHEFEPMQELQAATMRKIKKDVRLRTERTAIRDPKTGQIINRENPDRIQPTMSKIVDSLPALECPTCHHPISEFSYGHIREHRPHEDHTGHIQFYGYCEIPCPTCSVGAQERIALKKQAEFVQKLFGGADIPWKMRNYEFSSYPVNGDPQALRVVQGFIRHHADGTDQENKRGLWLHSDPGHGKTSLAVCALKEVLRHGNTGIFVLTSEFFKRLRASFNAQSRSEAHEDDLLDAIEGVPWLVLDDVGVEKPTDYILERMYSIITLRMQNQKYTIFTSNFSPRDLGAYWCKNAPANEMAAARIVERIKEYCLVKEVKGDNLREKTVMQ
jgi:DNA replication protein DnaC